MRITWQVEDGYVGGSRPQYTTIDDDELAECDSEEEKEQFITQCIQEDFMMEISWSEISRENETP